MRSPFSLDVVAAELRKRPLIVVDAGAAGGPAEYWREPDGLVKVIGFEPDVANFQALPSNEHWSYHQIALSDHDGSATFHAYGTVGSLERRRLYEVRGIEFARTEVQVRSLSSLRRDGVVPSLEIIKTDVEEHDIHVLVGAGDFLAQETLCVTSEFSFNQRTSRSNFGRMAALLADSGMMLFGMAAGRGALGELSGGDVLYLRDIGTVLAASDPPEVKRERLVKLFTLACLFRVPLYAYAIARTGEDSGLLEPKEAASLRAAVLRKVFLPSIVRSHRTARISAAFVVLAQIFAGPAWASKAGPGNNRLRATRWLFGAARVMPTAWGRRYEAELERRYQQYLLNRGILYALRDSGK